MCFFMRWQIQVQIYEKQTFLSQRNLHLLIVHYE